MKARYCLVLILIPFLTTAQTHDEMSVIMKFTGCINPEEMDQHELEQLTDYLRNPLEINLVTGSKIENSGLLTPYQTASLLDYRLRHGSVLSFTELAAVDGFGYETVQMLAPFLSLKSRQTYNGTGRLINDLTVRNGYKADEDNSYMYGARYRLSYGRFAAAAAASRKHGETDWIPSEISGYVSMEHSYGKIIAGDYNARFGQGLCLWNSSFTGSLTAPSAFMKKPSGISRSNSYTGAYAFTGLASDIRIKRWRVSLMLACPGIKKIGHRPEDINLIPAVNVSRYGRFGHLGFTHSTTFSHIVKTHGSFRIPDMKTSADYSFCIKGINVFGEFAYDWVNASAGAACGTDFKAGEDFRMAVLLKYLPQNGFSNEYGVALSGEFHSGKWIKKKGNDNVGMSSRRLTGIFSVNSSYYPESKSKTVARSIQMKVQFDCDFIVNEYIRLGCRLSERLRTWGQTDRTEIRLDAEYSSGVIMTAMRMNAVHCSKTGYLGYMEGAIRTKIPVIYLRAGIFVIDDWNDRIYVYERDAPGYFNVPAFYGRGVWGSFYLACRPAKWCKLYLRCSYIDYSLMRVEIRKPGKAELKLQTEFRF